MDQKTFASLVRIAEVDTEAGIRMAYEIGRLAGVGEAIEMLRDVVQ